MKLADLRVARRVAAVLLLAGGVGTRLCGAGDSGPPPKAYPNIPQEYLLEAPNPPDFWISTVDGVTSFLKERVHEGQVAVIGQSAGGRPIRAVFYGRAREGKGTTTFSGAVGAGSMRAYFGPDFDKKVYLAMASIHGGEFEGIVGLVNLLSVLETGKDLRGRPWPEIVAAAGQIDRLIVIPIANMDGRARVPLRMEAFHGTDGTIVQYMNTGGWLDGKLIGWPECKVFIPLEFARTQFPGGYPNDNGVNIMHDDFFGARQPETQALFDLAARERPDLILNLHTGAGSENYHTRMLRPVAEEILTPAFDGLYRAVQTGLALAGLQATSDPAVEADPAHAPKNAFNIDTALDFHCGALSVVVESPSHGYAGKNQHGGEDRRSADELLDAELVVQQEAMKYLVTAGGRARWAGGK
jgi:predicted deacylase